VKDPTHTPRRTTPPPPARHRQTSASPPAHPPTSPPAATLEFWPLPRPPVPERNGDSLNLPLTCAIIVGDRSPKAARLFLTDSGGRSIAGKADYNESQNGLIMEFSKLTHSRTRGTGSGTFCPIFFFRRGRAGASPRASRWCGFVFVGAFLSFAGAEFVQRRKRRGNRAAAS